MKRSLPGSRYFGWIWRRPAIVPLGLIAFSCLHPLGFRLNWGQPSQPPGIYRVSQKPLAPGRLVLLRLPARIAQPGYDRGYLRHPEVAKRIAALPGDVVEVTSEGLVVNGCLLEGTAPLASDSQGRPLTPFPPGVQEVPPGLVWVYSSYAPNSWDSRYWGPIPVDSVIGTLDPIWTWPTVATQEDVTSCSPPSPNS